MAKKKLEQHLKQAPPMAVPVTIYAFFSVYAYYNVYFSTLTRPEKKVAPPPMSAIRSGVRVFTSCLVPSESAQSPWVATTPGRTFSPTLAFNTAFPTLIPNTNQISILDTRRSGILTIHMQSGFLLKADVLLIIRKSRV